MELDINPSVNTTGSGFYFYEKKRPRYWFDFWFDTNKLGVRWLLSKGIFTYTSSIEGEALLSEITHIFIRRGEFKSENSFYSHHIINQHTFKVTLGGGHYLDYQLGFRYRLFQNNRLTTDDFLLPANHFSLEQGIYYIFWKLNDHPSLIEKHWTNPRAIGFASKVNLLFFIRSHSKSWGNRRDRRIRNSESLFPFLFQLWAITGFHPGVKMLRFNAQINGAYGVGNDDISKKKIGGTGKYQIQLSGLPWGSFVSDRFLHLRQSFHVLLKDRGSLEFSFYLDGLLLEDPHRNGTSNLGGIYTLGVGLDGERKGLKWDVILGWAPALSLYTSRLNFSSYAFISKKW